MDKGFVTLVLIGRAYGLSKSSFSAPWQKDPLHDSEYND